MAFEIPFHRINDMKCLLRKEANLSWYGSDKEDLASLPKLPSIEEAIAELDPSPPYLRCQNCKGRLLRGLQSMVCIFCASNPNKDIPPDPIKFKNTKGYRWLLDTLQLDGSETVESSTREVNESKVGKSSSKEEFPLSELLDLEIRWPSESEMHLAGVLGNKSISSLAVFAQEDSASNAFEEELSMSKQVVGATSNALQVNENLSLFEIVHISESAPESKEDEDTIVAAQTNKNLMFENIQSSESNSNPREDGGAGNAFHARQSLSLFENAHPSQSAPKSNEMESSTNSFRDNENIGFPMNLNHSESTPKSKEVESDDPFPDWEDNFQTAGAGTVKVDSKSFDPFAGTSSVDLTAHIDSMFGSGMGSTDVKVKDNEEPSASKDDDWFQVDVQSTANLEVIGQTSKHEMASDEKAVYNDDDWFQGEQWQSSSSKATDNKITGEDIDSFDAWSDFTSSKPSAQEPSDSLLKQTVHQMGSSVEHNADGNLLYSSNCSYDAASGILSDYDFFSGTPISPIKTTGMNVSQLKASVTDSMAYMDAKGGRDEAVEDEHISSAGTGLKADDVEVLMSQMHDLSFMLESNLSISRK